MAKPYEGGEDANPRRVVLYLIDNYEVDRPTAEKLVADDADGHVAKGMQLQSMAYYVGDQLAKASGLEERERDDDDDEDADDDDE